MLVNDHLSSESITYASLGCIVDIYVLQQNVRRVDDGHGPHLTLKEIQALKGRICGIGDGQLMRPPGIVRPSVDETIPCISVAIEGTSAVSIERNAISTKSPSSTLVLISNDQRILQPIVQIRVVPGECSVQFNVDVLQIGGLQYASDGIGGVHKHDAIALSSFGPATALEGFPNDCC